MGVKGRLFAAALALLITTSGVVSGSSSAETTPEVFSPQKTVKDGVYTKAQAERVTETYGKVCANCHDPAKVAAGKKPAPPLAGDLFLDSWKDRTVGELMATIKLTMPNDGSMTLTADDAADLAALILMNNKFPEGKAPLKYDDEGKKIVIVK